MWRHVCSIRFLVCLIQDIIQTTKIISRDIRKTNKTILIINQTVTLVCTSLLQDYSKVYDQEIQGRITACICSIVFYFIFGSLKFQRSWEWNQTTQVTRCSKIIDCQTRAFMYWRKMSTLHKWLIKSTTIPSWIFKCFKSERLFLSQMIFHQHSK